MACRISSKITYLVAALCFTTLGFTTLATAVHAQRVGNTRGAYNPITGQTEADGRYYERSTTRPVQAPAAAYTGSAVEQASYCDCGEPYMAGEPACGCDVGCGDLVCGDAVCGDSIIGVTVPAGTVFYTGFEATFLKPHMGSNTAFTVTDTTTTTATISETNFEYDYEFAPRVFVGWQRCGGDVGLRATWWQFDNGPASLTGSAPTSGLGSITQPEFGGIDISSTIATDVYTATTDLKAYSIDLEGVKHTTFCSWEFGVSGGLRYANIEQSYIGSLVDDTAAALGSVDYSHSIEGIGPTVAIDAYRPIGCRSGTFCKARGSLLFGDSKSRLVGGEDLSGTAVTTTSTTQSDDILSIYELQFGYRWHSPVVRGQVWKPFYSVAMEGQMWDGAGTASSQEGTLGFFGVTSTIGVNW